MQVEDVCARDVGTVALDATVHEAAREMGGFGVVVVVDTARRPVGLLTPRHIAVSGAVEGVRNRMSTEPIVATWNTKLSTAMARMRRAGVRHLPVVDLHGALVGLLTVEDGRRPRRA